MTSQVKYRMLFFALLFLSVQNSTAQTLEPTQKTEATKTLTYKIIDAPGKTYGYDIYNDDKLLIHQSGIPAMPGNKGFATKKDAGKVAVLVIEKLKNGIMPPTVTKEELQKLMVIP